MNPRINIKHPENTFSRQIPFNRPDVWLSKYLHKMLQIIRYLLIKKKIHCYEEVTNQCQITIRIRFYFKVQQAPDENKSLCYLKRAYYSWTDLVKYLKDIYKDDHDDCTSNIISFWIPSVLSQALPETKHRTEYVHLQLLRICTLREDFTPHSTIKSGLLNLSALHYIKNYLLELVLKVLTI